MKLRVLARRYVRALLDTAISEGDPERIERELAWVVGLLGSHPVLQKTLINPTVTASRKQALLAAILTRAEGLSPAVGRLLMVMAQRGRLGLLLDLHAAYRECLMEHQRIVKAQVTTAVPLPTDQAAALARRLTAATGRQVAVEVTVDPSIVGGVVARIGSLLYDGSVARQLARMKERLEQAVWP